MQGSFQYRVFISYVHRYHDWVEVLQRNLERALGAGTVCLDPDGIAAGHSWVSRIHAGLRQAQFVLLIATPEFFVSPRIADAWESLLWSSPNWRASRERIYLLHLASTPIPPLLTRIARTDFRDHEPGKYKTGLRELLGGLTAHVDGRPVPTLSPDTEVPDPPGAAVPGGLRERVVAWIEPWMRMRVTRTAVAGALGLARNALESYPSNACAASAALVRATGDDDARAALDRILRALQCELQEELDEAPGSAAGLEKLRREVSALRQTGAETGLVRACLDQQVVRLQAETWCERGQQALLDPLALKLRLLETGFPALPATESDRPAAGDAMGIRELLALTRESCSVLTHRWLLRAPAGAGKTTLIRHLAASLARENQPRWIPVFASLPALACAHEGLLDRLARQLRSAGQPARGLTATLDQLGQEGWLLLLLDGLDEVPNESRGETAQLVRDLSERWPQSPMVVTARAFGAAGPAEDFREVELLPLNRPQQLRLLALWLGGGDEAQGKDRAERVLRLAAQAPALRDLAGNPLLLTLLASLFECEGEVPAARSKLAAKLTEMLLGGAHRQARVPVPGGELVHPVLRGLAFAMTAEDRESISETQLEKSLQGAETQKLRDALRELLPWDRRAQAFWAQVQERTNLIAPVAADAREWRFLHPLLRDSLVAEQLAELGEVAWLGNARRLAGSEIRWAAPYELLADRVQDPDAFVVALASANRALALQVLATAPGLHPETCEKVLGLTVNRAARAQILASIPALLGEPAPVLALIDRLRRETRDGDDLYHLHQAVHGTIARWPAAAGESARLLARFHDHIPRPPDALFAQVRTGLNGDVPYWVEIRPAFFTMGSPPDEPGRWDDEGPQLDVELTKNFLLAVTPVTNEQFLAFDPEHPLEDWAGVPPLERLHHPVVNVSPQAAASFCRWLATHLPGVRLPTEAEWEFACRAGTLATYWSGSKPSDLDRVGWYRENSDLRSHAVGERSANPWGLYDMHGNVWEICADWYGPYPEGPVSAPCGPPHGEQRSCRGGSFRNKARHARAAVRLKRLPSERSKAVGFRLARDRDI